MKRNTGAGFTLVELIVVIAILGILAGIAIPVYSNYIKKANKAADEQLLAAVNTAAAAAVMDTMQTDMAKMSDNALSCSFVKDVPGITVSCGSNADVADVFTNKYFKGNENAAFKYFDSIVFRDGVFQGSDQDGSTASYTFHGVDITVSQESLEALQSSVFGTMTATELTGSVSQVTDIAAGLLATGHGSSYLANEGFQSFVSDTLGITDGVSSLTPEQQANALVLYAANQSAGRNGQSFVQAFSDGTAAQHILSNDPQYMAEAAAGYALLMGFAYSDAGENYMVGDKTVKEYFLDQSRSLQHASDIMTMFQTIDTATLADGATPIVEGQTGLMGFMTTSGAATLDGYLGALDMLNSGVATGNTDAINSVLAEGFASSDVIDLLNQVLSQNP